MVSMEPKNLTMLATTTALTLMPRRVRFSYIFLSCAPRWVGVKGVGDWTCSDILRCPPSGPDWLSRRFAEIRSRFKRNPLESGVFTGENLASAAASPLASGAGPAHTRVAPDDRGRPFVPPGGCLF